MAGVTGVAGVSGVGHAAGLNRVNGWDKGRSPKAKVIPVPVHLIYQKSLSPHKPRPPHFSLVHQDSEFLSQAAPLMARAIPSFKSSQVGMSETAGPDPECPFDLIY